MLKLYNTLKRKKQLFRPLRKGEVRMYTCGTTRRGIGPGYAESLGKGEVRMYTCGPTVYGYAHIGNFRAYLFEDLLRRYLEFRGYRVRQAMNLTDVDDKTINGAKEEGIPLNEYTKKFKDAFFRDIETLNIERAEHYPSATEHIPEMVSLIKRLLRKGAAYRGEDGSIYFDLSKFKKYGKLSKYKLKKLKSGARVKQDEYLKNQAADFALWKTHTKEDGPVFWETEFGKGRPGWHIECSAMGMKYLGESFDIHTGGIDNMFPHHENEIAQSEAATGKKFVNYWLHCAHLVVDGRKMSKSLGNYYTLRGLLDKGFSPKAIRFLLLSTHYRSELNLTMDALKASEKTMERFREFFFKLKNVEIGKENLGVKNEIRKTETAFTKHLDNDLDISNAVASVFRFMHKVNSFIDSGFFNQKNAEEVKEFMEKIDSVLGVMDFREKGELTEEEKKLVEERENFRKEKKFREADKIREELRKKGIRLDDTREGTKWKRIL